ncbi:hypothetical protein B0A50_07538 [Salinomyces thailandicus]|uniref:Serine/threonine-protein kinase MEC1 n=1 Tax=Salinomyces thailandicus TaxID=706561 RepID=A0A4U0TMX9_9PEZI|nr:hypothetical protein B0A50_07538 [Salinomyces thailandica]
MARGASKPNGVRPNRHGVHINGDGEVPPPSTLAAQIVQKQTRSAATQRQPQTAEDTTLANLLHEMLYNPAAAQETDANVNVQLVNVVAEAGLGPLAIDDPFAQLDMLLPQARDSIAVIDKTIRRQPELLFTPVVDDGPQLLLPLHGASEDLQRRLSAALTEQLRKGNFLAADALSPELRTLAACENFGTMNADLRTTTAAWLARYVPRAEFPPAVLQLLGILHQDEVMSDGEPQPATKEPIAPSSTAITGPRKRKRRKLLDSDAKSHSLDVSTHLTTLLTGGQSTDVSTLADLAPPMFKDLSVEERGSSLHLLATVAIKQPLAIIRLVCKLLELPELTGAKRLRVMVMLAVRECVPRLQDEAYLDLAATQIGRFCLGSLHSSVRELRIAAGQSLPHFLRDDLPDSLKVHNRHTALEYLRTISDRDVASEHETLIGAWGAVALTCGDRELNLVLLRLVDYLGHPNGLVSSVAAIEIEKLATTKGQTVEGLFKPFWGTIAVSIVQDLHTRPQKAQQLCEILNLSIDGFLVLTQKHTVPTLVLTKKQELLQRVAAARSTSVKDICLQPPSNRAAIIALLLTQSSADVEEAAMDCLSTVCRDFEGEDLAVLIRPDPALIGCEMLRLAGDAPEERKSRVHHAIKLFTTLAQRKAGSSKANLKANRTLIDFLDEQILGIMAHFSQLLEGVQGIEPIAERLRALRAIREMIRLIKAHASIALPQIRACLQSAMEVPELCGTAFSAWLELVSVLGPDDMIQVLGQTFALVLQYWPIFPQELQNLAARRISDLVKAHNKLLQENVLLLPSLSSIPALSKIGNEIDRLRKNETVEAHYRAFQQRLHDESRSVVYQAVKELCSYLIEHQEFVHDAALSEQPASALTALLRALLDATTKYSAMHADIANLCGKALGIVGCIDPNRVEAPRAQRKVLLLSNFERANEVVDWTIAFLEDVLVKTFKATTNARAQGFLAYTIQELLKFCGVAEVAGTRTRSSNAPAIEQKWKAMPEHVRITLIPFTTSRYHVFTNNALKPPDRKYPGFSLGTSYGTWLRSLVYDLLWRAKGDNPKMAFPLIARIIRSSDLGIAQFMLPYALLNIVLGGTVGEVECLVAELLAVLQCQPSNAAQLELAKQSSETIFGVLDYMASWLQEKKRVLSQTRADAYRTGHSPSDFSEVKDMGQIDELERFLARMPAEALANRAVECGAYARALFNWEQHIRQERSIVPSPGLQGPETKLYEKLQDIYASIDEPDGLEGIGAHLSILTEEQKVKQHAKSGRWVAAQAWYESRLADDARDEEAQGALLDCLRETGQYAALLRYAQTFLQPSPISGVATSPQSSKVLSLAIEGQWMTGDLAGLRSLVGSKDEPNVALDFDVGLGKLLISVADQDYESFSDQISVLRTAIASSMTVTGTSSLQACHGELKKLHALYEIEALNSRGQEDIAHFLEVSPKRLDALGSYITDKQYILALRRAAMRAREDTFTKDDLGSSWLTAARLARKAGNMHSAYNAVLQAFACGDQSTKLEEARLLWHDGHQRQAIQTLQTTLTNSGFASTEEIEVNSESSAGMQKQNKLVARAHLLLAKWRDASGQSQSKDMTVKYQTAAKMFQRWEKGHYYLGKHYNKLLEAEKTLPESKQSLSYRSGDISRSVVENMIRSIPFGNKFWHQTIPRVLTLWLDLGMKTLTRARSEDQTVFEKRSKALAQVNKQLTKYFERIPPYVFYTALPQMISRITHPHPDVWRTLSSIITRIASAHPSQALWGLLAVIRASDPARADRGAEILSRLKDPKPKVKTDGTDLRQLINSGQKLSDGLLQACEQHVEPRKQHVSLQKDLGFSHKLAPSGLVVPVEATLTANLPTSANSDKIRRHHAFASDKITIQAFEEDVLVLSSLQRPRKIVARGSDGKRYGLLCKPKDDLRKDQRLMEFNGIINRALKRDPESSKRRLYIKTYAVTPLSEESGTLEWVEGIKPTRDILLNLYARKGTRPNYNDIRNTLNEACASPENAYLFAERVQSQFPPSLWEWFTETYSEPETWFAARLRYARTAAVMSMTGHILGLGDRHGENLLLEESTGGVFHVDFNCLFDKGLTFEKPEMVPFRLTPNMVDAMGPTGYEGPFRKSSELTLGLLRQNKDTLMTVLETFLYDPTTDFAGKRKRTTPGVPETPQEILDSVDAKLKGLFKGENVPLGVEGYVDVLIREAVSPFNLASMYIGWCAFL